jgi:3-mercaptopyruvate sulfurtransferase SseA
MRHFTFIVLTVLAGASGAEPALVQPKELAAQLASHRSAITVFHVGPNVLYRSKHIPGAIFAGPANKPEGLDLLRAEAEKLAKDREIVIYCGCCPWERCPTIHPAADLLRLMGFTQVRALYLPNNFKADWLDQGYPADEASSVFK